MAAPLAAAAVNAATLRRGRKILGVAAITVIVLLGMIAALPGLLVAAFLPSAQAISQHYCASAGTAIAAPAPAPERAWSDDQIENARSVITTAAAAADKKAALAALTVAIAASDLTLDLTLSPAPAATAPLGLYRLTTANGWGSANELRDIPMATTRILTGYNGKDGITAEPTWASQSALQWTATLGLTLPAQTVQDALTAATALLKQLDPSTTDAELATGQSCGFIPITGDTVALAKALEPAIAAGTLRNAGGQGVTQIQNIADGTATADCGIDARILQVVTIAVNTFDSVGISDINRRCTGQLEGAGTGSWHYKDGGGRAIDFSVLNGTPLTGNDPNSRLLLVTLDPVMPPGSRAGQISCRPQPLQLTNFTQFVDTPCNHQHIDVGNAAGGLTGMPTK